MIKIPRTSERRACQGMIVRDLWEGGGRGNLLAMGEHKTIEEVQSDFKIVEVNKEGWAEFKAMEARHRKEYAESDQAKKDHEDWVNFEAPEKIE